MSGEDEEVGIAVGITSDDVARVLAGEGNTSSGRTPIDQARWSEYSASIRSRSSSIGLSNTNSLHESGIPRLRENPSFDMAWQTVDERDEVGLASGDETDDFGDEEVPNERKGEERTSAVVMAEEGRGLIVKGDGTPIVQLKVEPGTLVRNNWFCPPLLTLISTSGTTHLLVGSSSTPNSIPAFLTNTLPQICHSLLALDISANFLVALPPALASCGNLEELNVASNPLRVLPVFLSHLVALRVLIADATGIGTLPDSLAALDHLHTLSIRRNKMHSLPSWLCLLPLLQDLYLDGNPFQGPWQALVGPLLSKVPATPLYPPSTPSIPLRSASMPDPSTGSETDTDSDPRSADTDASFALPPEDDTIMPVRAPPLERSATSPAILPPVPPVPDRSLVRTNTAPNRSYQSKSRPRTGTTFDNPTSSHRYPDESGSGTDHELRKMKSAGELRTSFERYRGLVEDLTVATPERPSILSYSGSASSSNLLSIAGESPESDRLVIPKRYASLGVSALTPTRGFSRPTHSKSLFDVTWEGGETDVAESSRSSIASPPTSPPRPVQLQQAHGTPSLADRQATSRGRWGFLKKMSMGKMRADSPTVSRPNTSHGRTPRPEVILGSVSNPSQLSTNILPQIDVRFSTSGSLGHIPNSTPTVSLSPPINEEDLAVSTDAPPESTNPGKSLAPTSSPRASKRRSFLPVDGSAVANLVIPSPTHFIQEASATGNLEMDEPAAGLRPSSAVDADDFVARREEERARETYTRALRSVMAYLKDMNDLNLSQGTALSMYGGSPEDSLSISRSRRPTVVERANSEGTISRAASISGQLRSPEAMAGLRSGTTSQTISVATTDSSGSSEERKYKDDKGKRALVIREIIEYVQV